MGQPIRAILGNIGQLDAPLAAIAQGLADFWLSMTNDNTNFIDICFVDGFDNADKDGLIGDRDELFCTSIRQWIQACAFTTAQD